MGKRAREAVGVVLGDVGPSGAPTGLSSTCRMRPKCRYAESATACSADVLWWFTPQKANTKLQKTPTQRTFFLLPVTD